MRSASTPGAPVRVEREQDRVARLAEIRLGAQHEIGHHGVRDVAQDEADREGLAASQALGEEVALVVEAARRRP